MYLAPGVFERVKQQPAAMRDVERALLEIPGVDRVVWSDQINEQTTDKTLRAAALSFRKSRTGDLIVLTKQHWFLTGRNSNNATGHGTPYEYDQHVPVILMGPRVKPGHYDDAATPADIAPTLAMLAGVRLPKAEGRLLQEALR
jgi:arylsulfatase A-like enzyme